ncbi:lysoplasmalogenase [Micromonospora sp. DR5-3]|uniref:lysoplasmalogenase n=1 Tax=unclassified Micromonospora TaxID=2617518 RepID=UPI0011DA4BF9|nr:MULTISPECIES: lysoplasmalogenase [unclassified Micromonospora]MCW3817442.1 lysoplasmalogenase [Micromonospora sp. DR5-3]TYC22884.1 lysoplasmalogenase [Micromonospora sp. MP36]
MRRPWLLLFGAVAAIELAGVAVDSTAIQWLTKPLLAPLLLAYLWDRRRRVDPVAVGLVAATAGDVALLVPGQAAFLAGMGCFLVTQLAFLTAFVRHRRPPAPAMLAYVALWAVANALLWGALGPLRLPVLGYSLALSLMAAAATGVSRRVAAGGALFLGSDLLIGLDAAGVHLPGHGLLVMTTYIAALLLITTGWAAAPTTADRHPSAIGPALA